MIEQILALITAVVEVYGVKDGRKYIDKIETLKRQIYEEENKGETNWDDALLTNLKFELRLVTTSFAADIRKPNTSNFT